MNCFCFDQRPAATEETSKDESVPESLMTSQNNMQTSQDDVMVATASDRNDGSQCFDEARKEEDKEKQPVVATSQAQVGPPISDSKGCDAPNESASADQELINVRTLLIQHCFSWLCFKPVIFVVLLMIRHHSNELLIHVFSQDFVL